MLHAFYQKHMKHISVADADTIFLFCGFFYLLSFFPRLISAVADWMSTIWYFHTWCGLSANLGWRSETCCTRLAENTGRKKSPKIWHLGKAVKANSQHTGGGIQKWSEGTSWPRFTWRTSVSCCDIVWRRLCREPKEGMMETVSHTFKRELDHVVDRDMMDTLSQVINGSLDSSVYVFLSSVLTSSAHMLPPV